MSITTYEEPTMEKIKPTSASDLAEADTSARSIFTSQTGQTLIALGTLFKHVPPFNETIDKSTVDTLISIGRKLKGLK
ncbi:MAG: hypothetical protein IPG44_08805 [Anaerolineales bacterium]|jgi:hypothetical protein|nr:hypothetical protein [Anaerolineales bacterium]MCC6985725.1 hypothetical protein [Anaerolineales bacterium]